jgi:hypothetical protein
MDVADRFRPRSGACFRCFHLPLSGETSQPGLRAPASALSPDPARILLRFGRIRSFSRKVGTALFGRRSLALRHGSCLLPLKLHSIPFGRHPFRRLPFDSDLIAPRQSSPGLFFPSPSTRFAQSATVRTLFPHPVATPGRCSGYFLFRPKPLGDGPPHWLTVATIGFHRLCSPLAPKPRNEGRDSAHGWFPRLAPLFFVSQTDTVRRLASCSHDARRSDPPRGSR